RKLLAGDRRRFNAVPPRPRQELSDLLPAPFGAATSGRHHQPPPQTQTDPICEQVPGASLQGLPGHGGVIAKQAAELIGLAACAGAGTTSVATTGSSAARAPVSASFRLTSRRV